MLLHYVLYALMVITSFVCHEQSALPLAFLFPKVNYFSLVKGNEDSKRKYDMKIKVSLGKTLKDVKCISNMDDFIGIYTYTKLTDK